MKRQLGVTPGIVLHAADFDIAEFPIETGSLEAVGLQKHLMAASACSLSLRCPK
jgi:hypothetical protein